ncbi:MAG: SpoIID/LytB domain protein, partial [Candidatus Woesebacteria bacterium GW2011_GWC2_33_12]
NEDKKNITDLKDKIDVLNRERAALERDKTQMAEDKIDLENQKVHLEAQEVYLNSQIASARNTQNQLASQLTGITKDIANLSAKEQQILAAKAAAAAASTSVGSKEQNGGVISEGTPSKTSGDFYSFWSYGFPHRVGMNQYGAYGRALAGQTVRTILHSYYANTTITGLDAGTSAYPVPEKIKVDGYGWISFEDLYLKGIGEMPSSWSMEALKAQAIAARSYALNYTNNGTKSICPSQSCQVVKREINNGTWQAAVDATRGMVLTSGGLPITAWYSSTHGGYAYTSGDIGWSNKPWTKRLVDANSGIGNFSDLFNNSYDKSSPTFYCDWGSRTQYNKTAWLKPEEVADIANVILLAKADGSTQKHLSQTDKPNPDGVDTWDENRVKNELSSRGITSFNSVSNVSIGADFGSGRTTTVTIDGRSFDGQDFKSYFNLRSPSNIQIVGPLFNIEKR